MDSPIEQRYTIKYRNNDGAKIELCVKAESITEAVEAAMHEVPSLKLRPSRICSVIGGCN